MQRSRLTISVCLFLLLSGGCRKHSQLVFDTHFYTLNATSKTFLTVDGDNLGELPSFKQDIYCEDSSLSLALSMSLAEGTHKVVGKDSVGALKFALSVLLARDTLGSTLEAGIIYSTAITAEAGPGTACAIVSLQ